MDSRRRGNGDYIIAMKDKLSIMLQRRTPVISLILMGVFLYLVISFAADQYLLTRGVVRFLCISCLGMDG